MEKMIRKILAVILLLFIICFQDSAFCQDRQKLRNMEDSLQLLLRQITTGNDSLKESLNTSFKKLFQRTLVVTGSFDYPFDSLKTVSMLMSPDKKFRIITWNLPLSDGTNRYDGFILFNTKDRPDQLYFILTDHSDTIHLPETAILGSGNWYGALYYTILLNEDHGRRYYTLIGWDGLSSLVTQKIIEILYFDDLNKPHFGAKIFKDYKDNECSRVIFRYSANATMFLNYDEQFLPAKKKWNPSKKEFESTQVKAFMIVCDELVPPDPQLEGLYEYYVPSSESFNGFIFSNGHWQYYQNIDARNQ
jgi:hypothetical protein